MKNTFVGLLHDPIDKAFCIIGKKSHEQRAKDISMKLLRNLGRDILNEIENHHKKRVSISLADWNASAANRGLIPYNSQALELVFQNPLSGYYDRLLDKRPILTPLDNFTEICDYSEKRSFHKTFREIIHSYHNAYKESDLGKIAYILPEDTRIPSSPIISHVVLTSVLSSIFFDDILRDFYLVFVDIGGIQSFISNSRKTRDFIASSTIISLLALEAIKYISDEYGPNHVVSPWILDIPLVDIKIFNGKIQNPINDLSPIIPGTILAVVPARDSSDKLREEIRTRMKYFWERIVEKYTEILSNNFSLGLSQSDKDTMEEQLRFENVFTKIRIVTLSYQRSKGTKILSDLDNIGRFEEIGQLLHGRPGGVQYPHQELENFESYIKLTQITNNYIKYMEDFELKPEPGGDLRNVRKCLACGARRIAFPRDDKRWSILEKKNVIDSGELLCHLCLLKRLFRYVLADEYEIDKEAMAIPSVSEFGGIWFKISLLALALAAARKGVEFFEDFREKVLFLNHGKSLYISKVLKEISIILNLEERLFKRVEFFLDLFPTAKYLYDELDKNHVVKSLSKDDREQFLETLGFILRFPSDFFNKEEIDLRWNKLKSEFEDESLREVARKLESEKILEYNIDKASSREELLNVLEEILGGCFSDVEEFFGKITEFALADSEIIREAKKILFEGIAQKIGIPKKTLYEIFSRLLPGNGDDKIYDFIPISTRPQNRFTLIRGDGDDIGKWISGEMSPPYILFHHEEIEQGVKNLQNITNDILLRNRPISPAYLSTLSMILTQNALLVSKVVRALGGYLIYSGGDDVLAFSPPESWHLIYLLIRFLYSSEFILRKFALGLDREEVELYNYDMGWLATQSYGIVIAHHKADLRYVIKYSLNLEEQSKERKVNGIKVKDGLTIALISRAASLHKATALPNMIIYYNDEYKVIRQVDAEIRDMIGKAVCDPKENVIKKYKQRVDEFLTKLMDDFGNKLFIGVMPNNVGDIEKIFCAKNTVLLSPLSFAFYLAKIVISNQLSRRGLHTLYEFYVRQRDLETTSVDLLLQYLRYELSRKFNAALTDQRRRELLEWIISTIKAFSSIECEEELSKKKLTCLEFIPLAVIFERILKDTV